MLFRRGNKWWGTGYYWDPKAGARKRWRKSTGVVDDGTARTKRVAEQVAHEIAQSYAVGGVRKARSLTIEGAIKLHVAAHERRQSAPDTLEIVTYKAARLMDFFGPDFDCNALSDASFIEYSDHRKPMRGRVKGQTVTPGTIHRELRTMREALKDAKRAGKYDGEIPAMPDLGVIYTARETWIDKPESQRVLLALPVQWRDHFVMYRQLGLDESELYKLWPSDINWQRNELRVRGTKTEKRDRILPLTRETRAILEDRAAREPMFTFWHNALRDLARACEKAGVKRVNLKDLRRSFATELAIAGVPALHLKDLMGHASLRMLEQVYARVGRGQHMHDAMAHVSELRPAPAQLPKAEEGEP